MPDRRSVIIVMYDLPVQTSAQQRENRVFHKLLLSKGYIPLQKSAYVKLVHNTSSSENEIRHIKAASPHQGCVYALPLSLGEFKKMSTLVGDPFNTEAFSDDIVYL